MNQNAFLETLRSRLIEAQKHFAEKQQALQKAQVEFNNAAQELNSWQFAVAVETKKEQANLQPTDQQTAQLSVDVSSPSASGSDVNKTTLIRQIIQQHPSGITPAQLWKQLDGRIEHRAYIYSTLKRLKDKGEVVERRGRYMLRPAVAQGAAEGPMVQ
jgi:hypothetical protein